MNTALTGSYEINMGGAPYELVPGLTDVINEGSGVYYVGVTIAAKNDYCDSSIDIAASIMHAYFGA